MTPVLETVAPIGFGDVAVGTLSGVSFDVIADFVHVIELGVAQVCLGRSFNFNNAIAGLMAD